MKVLIVDGSAGVRTRLGERFAEEGFFVLGAGDLDVALAMLREDGEISAVILDLHLDTSKVEPGVDSVMRLRREAPRAVLVVLTSDAHELFHAECTKSGADFVYDKAHEFERAVEAVRTRQTSSMTRTS